MDSPARKRIWGLDTLVAGRRVRSVESVQEMCESEG